MPSEPTTTETGVQFLLFAGRGYPPRGGLGDLVATFTSETAARSAFRKLRLQRRSSSSWAQLAVLDPEKGLKPLCWFGIGASPDGNPMDVHADRRPRVSKRTAILLTAMVAVATSMVGFLVDDGGGCPQTSHSPPVSGAPPAP